MMDRDNRILETIIIGIIIPAIVCILITSILLMNNNKYDINNDNKVNSQDLYELKKHIIDENSEFTKEDMLKVQGYIMNYNNLNNDERILFDINDDGIINVQDYVLMKNKVMGDSNENID